MNGLLIGIIVAAFSIGLGSVIAYNVRQSAEMQKMRIEIATLSTQVSPLWAQIQSRIAADLHHPHPRYFEMDKLLEKLEALTITQDERVRLDTLLMERSVDMHDDITDIQRKEARLMSQVMHIVLLEAKGIIPIFLAWLSATYHHWR
jgi:hypothetical protein